MLTLAHHLVQRQPRIILVCYVCFLLTPLQISCTTRGVVDPSKVLNTRTFDMDAAQQSAGYVACSERSVISQLAQPPTRTRLTQSPTFPLSHSEGLIDVPISKMTLSLVRNRLFDFPMVHPACPRWLYPSPTNALICFPRPPQLLSSNQVHPPSLHAPPQVGDTAERVRGGTTGT